MSVTVLFNWRSCSRKWKRAKNLLHLFWKTNKYLSPFCSLLPVRMNKWGWALFKGGFLLAAILQTKNKMCFSWKHLQHVQYKQISSEHLPKSLVHLLNLYSFLWKRTLIVREMYKYLLQSLHVYVQKTYLSRSNWWTRVCFSLCSLSMILYTSLCARHLVVSVCVWRIWSVRR